MSADYDQLAVRFRETHDTSYLKEIFRMLDLDSDGFLSKEELLRFYESRMDFDPKFISEALLRLGDTNKDGFLDEQEYVAVASETILAEVKEGASPMMSQKDEQVYFLLARFQETRNSRYLERAFNIIDLNHDGFISKQELQASYIVKESAGDSEAIASFFLRVGDLNQDGVLSLEEFEKLIVDSFGQEE